MASALALALSGGCSSKSGAIDAGADVPDLAPCEDFIAEHPSLESTGGNPPIEGRVQVTESEPSKLRMERDGSFVELTFPAFEDAVLPPVGAEVELRNHSFYPFALVLDPDDGTLLFEVGEPYGDSENEGPMHTNPLPEQDPLCLVRRSVIGFPSAIRFEVDGGDVVLRSGETQRASLDGRPVVLHTINAFHFEPLPGHIVDDLSDLYEGMIVPVAP